MDLKCNAAKEELIEKFKQLLPGITEYGIEIARGYPNNPTGVDLKIADLLIEIKVILSNINEAETVDQKILTDTIKNMSDPQSAFLSILPILDQIWYDEQNDPDFLYKLLYQTHYDVKKFEEMVLPLKGQVRDIVKLGLPSIFKKGKVPPKVNDYFRKLLSVANLKVELMKIYRIDETFNGQLNYINDECAAAVKAE
ncbi:hypothetical protein M9Y10_014541 [Tritrichomonas musculus]|uniref:Uncharacterized protein n=1 Tax=Tritrichomonas musculus TaxID=1915356 RepID=A0ABR2KZW6_9EUKA